MNCPIRLPLSVFPIVSPTTPLLALVCGLILSVAHGAPPSGSPMITNITVVAGTPQLTISSPIGTTNEIQMAPILGQSAWQTLSSLVVTQNPYVFIDTNTPSDPQRFYRVIDPNGTSTSPAGMALIPAGDFQMGDSFAEGEYYELPVHTVYVSAFYMDKYEVTKALWDTVAAWSITNGYSYDFPGSGKAPNHPVQSIDWYDMVKWCNARSEMEHRAPSYYTDSSLTNVYRTGQVAPFVNWNAGYRLPTEAEWEKAARGGATGHRFPWADNDTISHAQANYYSSTNYAYDLGPTAGYNPAFVDGVLPYTSPVGSFAPNGYGLYDMAGNVWEWCWDYAGSYPSMPQSDPHGPDAGSTRVGRGGTEMNVVMAVWRHRRR